MRQLTFSIKEVVVDRGIFGKVKYIRSVSFTFCVCGGDLYSCLKNS